MPVDERKKDLRSVLEQKSTEELEELLALDFTEDETWEPDVDYITTILEVIRERARDIEKEQAVVPAAWEEFKEYLQEYSEEEAETGAAQEQPTINPIQIKKMDRKPRRNRFVLRYCAVIAAVIVLFCGTASAFGFDILQALADWTVETFHFLTDSDVEVTSKDDIFKSMRLQVAKRSDTSMVPTWAPKDSISNGEVEITERTDRVRIYGAFSVGEREFSVYITIYNAIPENYSTTYQKDFVNVYEYTVDGVTHYLMRNNNNSSAMWTNGNVEGHIQGNLSIDELEWMIDSIYRG